MASVTRDDVKPMVDRMIHLLRQPHRRTRRQRIADWIGDRVERDAEWRANALSFFCDLRNRLDDPKARFDDEAHHLVRWMDWDLDLERQEEEIQRLTPRIQQALDLLERSRRRGAS